MYLHLFVSDFTVLQDDEPICSDYAGHSIDERNTSPKDYILIKNKLGNYLLSSVELQTPPPPPMNFGQQGHLFIYFRVTREQRPKMRGTGEQRQCWGTLNIGNQEYAFGEQGNNTIYFRGTMDQIPHPAWEGLSVKETSLKCNHYLLPI